MNIYSVTPGSTQKPVLRPARAQYFNQLSALSRASSLCCGCQDGDQSIFCCPFSLSKDPDFPGGAPTPYGAQEGPTASGEPCPQVCLRLGPSRPAPPPQAPQWRGCPRPKTVRSWHFKAYTAGVALRGSSTVLYYRELPVCPAARRPEVPAGRPRRCSEPL